MILECVKSRGAFMGDGSVKLVSGISCRNDFCLFLSKLLVSFAGKQFSGKSKIVRSFALKIEA